MSSLFYEISATAATPENLPRDKQKKKINQELSLSLNQQSLVSFTGDKIIIVDYRESRILQKLHRHA